MPNDVTILLVGGNHGDAQHAQSLLESVKKMQTLLASQRTPIVLAVENTPEANAEMMIAYTAQMAAELEVMEEGPNEGETVEQRVIAKAAALGAELKAPKPYYLDYKASELVSAQDGSPVDVKNYEQEIERIDAYKANCSLYQFAAAQQGMDVVGIDRSPQDVAALFSKTDLKFLTYADEITQMEPMRIERMASNLVEQVKKLAAGGNGGVILTPDLGLSHLASLNATLDSKAKVANVVVSIQPVAALSQGVTAKAAQATMWESLERIGDMKRLYEKEDVSGKLLFTPGGEMTDALLVSAGASIKTIPTASSDAVGPELLERVAQMHPAPEVEVAVIEEAGELPHPPVQLNLTVGQIRQLEAAANAATARRLPVAAQANLEQLEQQGNAAQERRKAFGKKT